MRLDYLIVGSGLFGATFAHHAKQNGKKCLVLEKRNHLGGNIYCESIDGRTGLPSEIEDSCTIHVHKYGAHIFHTDSKRIWDFVNSFVEFNRYTNCPVANYRGELFNLPFNMNTFNQIWPDVHNPEEARLRIEEQKSEEVLSLGGKSPNNLEEQALCLVGKDIYFKLIKEYTEKQWGRECRDLPASIIKRLPVRMVFDNNYFNDRYQGIPIGGYNKLTDGLLKGIDCLTNTDFFKSICPETGLTYSRSWRAISDNLVYSGELDRYFDYKYGKLEWRTVSFNSRLENTPNYQGNAVINYTSHDEPYTRVIEHKHFEMFGKAVYDCPKTIVSEEYSVEFEDGMEPYYPINDVKNNILAKQYHDLAEMEEGVIFGGRLGQYKYLDMAPAVEQALNVII